MISVDQIDAASLYWAQLLMGDVQLAPSMPDSNFFLNDMLKEMREDRIKELTEKKPDWSIKFMNALKSLLHNENNYCILDLHYEPSDILKEAAEKANIDIQLFPRGKLSMRFDTENHIFIENGKDIEKIDAKEFLEKTNQKMAVMCKR